jgi:dTDP-4-dehydrorhamnose 3,5-epimerase
MPFRFQQLEIPDVILIEARAFEDARGFFMEGYKQTEYDANGIAWRFVQDNYSRSARGVLRGLHYQKDPNAQGKLVCVSRGTIFDVAVDIRRGSPTYRRWVGVEISDQNHRLVYVPVGFAHGFCTLSDEADVMYKVTAEYAPQVDRGILWSDPALGIRWPIGEPILSAKDAGLPVLAEADNEFTFPGATA